ncbi:MULTISPECIES: hypothetical protein [Mycobacteriaceae]|uniref:Uncharacterized protein n=1 Tax=Mycolicibacterium parafortuitum TaxID=39692 RepID=A0ACC6MJR6_MYCPF|nr:MULTISPECIES: hypothetical protein [Mycobacteriaceae]MDZ5087173.1 hypothetical protein [Mycolicibacterium parafortuitum]MEC9322224.1 hypothetical protein [Actinomycetota bacterium]GFM17339.1 uncharacterized protein PO1_contig-016-53 [Mycobacterium sp. PO1]GFM22246.1 uncharacterized protein PO2_contig-007-37 [Mycobacterium sp. PO2]
MLRDLAAAALMMLAAGACLPAPSATAADGDQLVDVQDGRLRCLVSAHYGAAGQPMAICGMSNGAPFGASPNSIGSSTPLNLAVMNGTGQSYWAAGTLPGTAADSMSLGVGQTYTANGWTIINEAGRARVKNDHSGHGLILNVVTWRAF